MPKVGFKHSEEAKRKMSESHKGIKHSEDSKQKMSELRKGKFPEHAQKALQKAWEVNRGSKHSEETKIKIGEANKISLKGKHNANEFKIGDVPWNKGFVGFRKGWKMSKEARDKLSNTRKGIIFTEKHKKNISEAQKGKIISLEHRRKLSKAIKGEKHYNWKDGVTTKNHRIRNGIEIRLWREAVFARDDWTCQECNERGGKLHPHHIKGFAEYPELRFAIDNGLTLCVPCHRIIHKKNSPELAEQVGALLEGGVNA